MATGPGGDDAVRSGGLRAAAGRTAIAAGALGLVASAAGLFGDPNGPGLRRPPRPASTRTGRAAPSGDRQADGEPDRGATGARGSDRQEDRSVTDQQDRISEHDSPSTRRAKTAADPDDPRKPEGPEDLKKRSWTYVLKKVFREFLGDQCTDLAAGLVYFLVLALFPAILAIVSILGLFGQQQQTTSAVLNLVGQFAPDLKDTLGPIVKSLTRAPGAPLTFTIGVLGAILSASGYIRAFGRAMNRIYSIDEGRPAWKLRPAQLLVTVVIIVLLVLGALVLVSDTLAKAAGFAPALVTVIAIAKYVVLLAIAIAVVAILYYFSPNVRQPKFKWTSTGSTIALVVWALASLAFGFYVSSFGNYQKTYGSIAGVIIFLLWLWLTNIALLFGAEWDAEIERGRELQAGLPAEEQIQLPPRDTKASDKKHAKHEKDVAEARRLRETHGEDSDPGKASDPDKAPSGRR